MNRWVFTARAACFRRVFRACISALDSAQAAAGFNLVKWENAKSQHGQKWTKTLSLGWGSDFFFFFFCSDWTQTHLEDCPESLHTVPRWIEFALREHFSPRLSVKKCHVTREDVFSWRLCESSRSFFFKQQSFNLGIFVFQKIPNTTLSCSCTIAVCRIATVRSYTQTLRSFGVCRSHFSPRCDWSTGKLFSTSLHCHQSFECKLEYGHFHTTQCSQRPNSMYQSFLFKDNNFC